MPNSSKSLANVTLTTSLSSSDRLVGIKSPATTANVIVITVGNFINSVSISNSVPANSTSNGTPGMIRADNTYIYVCVSNNTWGRVSINLTSF